MSKLSAFEATLKSRSDKDFEDWFREISSWLMNRLILQVGDAQFRIVECEIYYNGLEHKDPYVHNGEQQQALGRLYFNKVGGLDLTFGNENVYAGILIRGIKNLATNTYVSEVTKVTVAVFSSLGNVLESGKAIQIVEGQDELKLEKVYSVKRFGLRWKKDNDSNGKFLNAPYRYLIELNSSHKFKDKTNVVKTLVESGNLKRECVKEVLGYQPRNI